MRETNFIRDYFIFFKQNFYDGSNAGRNIKWPLIVSQYKVYRKAFPFLTVHKSVSETLPNKFQSSLCLQASLWTVCPGLDSLQEERLLWCSIGIQIGRCVSREFNGRIWTKDIHICVVLKLRMCGFIPPLPQALMMWCPNKQRRYAVCINPVCGETDVYVG